MTQFETLTLWIGAAQVLVSFGAVAAIIAGISQMRRAGDQRAQREDARHAESMEALGARHAESMEALRARHAESMEALRALIERTDRAG